MAKKKVHKGKYPIFARKGPSETAIEAFRDSFGSVIAYCQACGRTNFSDDLDDRHNFEQGAYEDLLKKRAKDPKGYVPHEGSLTFAYVWGIQVIVQCPCHYLRMVEKRVLAIMPQAMRYYRDYAKARQFMADALVGELEATDAILERRRGNAQE